MRLAAQSQRAATTPRRSRVVEMIAGLIDTPYRPPQLRGRETHAHPRPLLRGRGRRGATGWRSFAWTGAMPSPSRPTAWSFTGTGPQEAEKRLDRALAADLFATSIANGAFGLLPTSTRHTTGIPGGQARRSTPSSPKLHPLPGRGRAAGLHRATPTACGVGPLPVHPLRAEPALLGLPRPGAGGLRPGGAPVRLPQGGPHPRRLRRGAR